MASTANLAGITLLPLSSECADEAYAVYMASELFPWSRNTFLDSLAPPYFAYQLLLGEQLAGFYIAQQVLDEVTLMEICVLPQHRRQGLARKLLDHLQAQCRQRQIYQCLLEVRRSNSAAIQLYRSANFEQVGERKNYYPSHDGKEGAIVMSWSCR